MDAGSCKPAGAPVLDGNPTARATDDPSVALMLAAGCSADVIAECLKLEVDVVQEMIFGAKVLLECEKVGRGSSTVMFRLTADGTVRYQVGEAHEPDVDAFMESLAPLLRPFCELEASYRVDSVWTCRPVTKIRVAHASFNHEVSVYNHQEGVMGLFYGPGRRFQNLLDCFRGYPDSMRAHHVCLRR